jgi:hypothetical protein
MVIKNKKLEELLAKHDLLDDNCREIFLTLLAYGNIRHNKLMITLKKLDVKITRPTLDTHLKHLVDSGLVECKTAFQSSEYALIKEIYEFLRPLSREEIKQWLDLGHDKGLPEKLKPLKIDREEFYKTFSDQALDKMVSDDVNSVLGQNLFELKSFVMYDLKLDKFEGDSAFWKLVGNPIYRMHEKTIARKCRDSSRYREAFFSKMDLMVKEFKNK